jgi:SNF2 family DNA or RNA helicase
MNPAQFPHILFFKGGPGSGWYGPEHGGNHGPGASGASPPSSAEITTLEQAQAYWRAHFSGKTIALNVHNADNSDPIPIKVRFGDTNHAYTTDADKRHGKSKKRAFIEKRAKAMDRIIPTIEHPKQRIRNFDADLLLEGRIDGEHYTIVLKWHAVAEVYEFKSAHFKSAQEIADLSRNQSRKNNEGPLRKSEPCRGEHGTENQDDPEHPQALRLSSPYGSEASSRDVALGSQLPEAPVDPARNCLDSLPSIADLFKAYPPLEHAHTLLLWDADTLIKRMSPDGESDAPSAGAKTKAPSHHAAIPAGARWITVHPGGNKNAKGQPILVVPHPHKKGAYSVIGGAGGKLNYLKIRGLKSDQDYKAEAGGRHAAKKQLEQQRIAADREAGIHTGKTAQKQAISAQTHTAQRGLIEQVARMAGWKEAETTFPAEKYQHLSPKAYQAMQNQHHAELLKRTRKFIDLHRQQTLADSDRRAEALGAIPLTASPDAPETLTVNDLDPVRPADRGLGFNPDYRARAEQEAGGAEQLNMDVQTQREETAAASGREPADPAAQQESAERRRDTAAQLKTELEAQAPPPKPKVSLESAQLNTQQVIDLLAADKQLRTLEKQARTAKGKIDEAKTLDEAKTYNLTLGERPSDDEIVQDLKDQLKTGQTVAFLQRIEKSGSEDDLARHVGAGAAAAANSVGLTLGGQALVDRSVIDVLGVSGAAQVIARQLHSTLSPEDLADAIAAMEAHHVETYSTRAEEAMSQADAWDELADVDSPDANEIVDGHGIAAVESLNRQRIDALAESRRVLGSALGEFEMNAAIIMALKEGRPDRHFEVSLGAVNPEAAVVQLRALGLAPEHFKLDKIGDQQFATVTAAGLDRLSRPVDRDTLTRARDAQDIIDGHQDEDHWLPSGVAKRPDLAIQAQPGQAAKLAEPYDASQPPDQALQNYIGGRTADGDAAADIYADLLSNDWIQRNLSQEQRAAHISTINSILPTYRERKKLADDGTEKTVREHILPEHYQPLFEQWADSFVQEKHGVTRNPLHRQDLTLDDKTADSIHRALSAEPAGAAAYKAIGDLTPQDQSALRAFFEKHVGGSTENLAKIRNELKELKTQEPTKYKERQAEPETLGGFDFGEPEAAPDPEEILTAKLARLEQIPVEKRDHAWNAEQLQTQRQLDETQSAKESDRQTPEWKKWHEAKQAKQKEMDREGVEWKSYVSLMGRKKAYEAVQDLIRSKTCQTFADAYNTLHPEAPLKTGRMAIRNHLDHLSAVDPDEREKQLKILRETQGKVQRRQKDGRFNEGGIKAEMTARKEAEAGFKSANMDLFGGGEPADKPMLPHQRHTLGHVIEQRLAGLCNTVGHNFKPGQAPVGLFNLSMSGQYKNQQRAVKLIIKNKRVALAQGVGSGKTIIGLGAFAELHAQGKVKKGVFCVPSIVQEQMHAEALRFLEAGKFQWSSGTGASRAERIAALKDPDNHFSITTHQSLRDDLLYLGAQHAGMTESALARHLDTMTPQARQDWMKTLLDKEGINADYCLPYNANITLADGSNTMIGDIVENRLQADVLCVNLETGKIESKPIVGWQKIEQHGDQLIVVHAGNQSVTCTEDHKIWTTNRGYVRAVDIKPGDELVAIPFESSKISPENTATTQGDTYADQRHDSRIITGRRLHNIIQRRNTETEDEAFSPPERIPHAQIRNPERSLPVAAKVGNKWRIWYGVMDFSNQLHGLAARIVRRLLSGREKATYGAHSEVFKPDCSGLLVHGRWQQIAKHSNDKHSRILERAATFFKRLDQGKIWAGNYRSNGKAKKSVLHADEKKGSTTIFQSDWRVCAGMYAVQANQHFPGLSPTIIRDDTRQVMLYLWNQLCERIGLYVSVMSSEDNQTKESRLVSKKQGIHLRANDGGTPSATWLSILRNLRRIVSGKNNKACDLLNRMQQGKETKVCAESLLSTNKIRTRERDDAPICEKTILPEKIIVTSTSRASAPRYVYDLTVADNHNFFAYGILVSNCFFDESHVLLNREGKENSAMANVLDSLSANASHYVNATADPVKNSVDEAFSLLQKMNPGKYHDRAEFMRRYGPDTRAAKDGLRRELLQHLYPGRIDPGKSAEHIEQRLDLTSEQHQAIAEIESAAGAVKLARIQGKAHVEGAKKLAPQLFKDAPEDQHEAIAKEVAKSASILKNTATRAVIDRHPNGAKQQAVHQIIADNAGKPGVIFCHSLDAVKQLTEQLKAKGHRVVSMTGADSAQKKAEKKAQFNPEKGGTPTADIMVTSDAGAVGMNAQRGQWLVQYDSPDTAMVHAQRGGRIHRLGQQNNVKLIDLIANHPNEDAARKRLSSKYELRETITSPYEGMDDTGLAHHLQQRRADRLPKPEAEPVEYDLFGDPIPRQTAPVAQEDEPEDQPNDDQESMF